MCLVAIYSAAITLKVALETRLDKLEQKKKVPRRREKFSKDEYLVVRQLKL